MVSERDDASKFELSTVKPSPACDLKIASDSKPIIDSELSVSGRIKSLMVYHAGTCSDMIPVWGKRDAGLNDMVKMASITANFSDELSITTSVALTTDC